MAPCVVSMRGFIAGFLVGLWTPEEGGVAPGHGRLLADEPGVGVEGGAPGS